MPSVQFGIFVNPESGLGLTIKMAQGWAFVQRINPHGSVCDWNSNAPPEMEICIGDRIDGYTVKGRQEMKLRTGKELESLPNCEMLTNTELKTLPCRAIVLKLTKPCVYCVTAKAPFGVSSCVIGKAFFVIKSISLLGSLQKWNEECPDKPVSVGDIILGVNGVKGTAFEVERMLKNGDGELQLMISHFSDLGPSMQVMRM